MSQAGPQGLGADLSKGPVRSDRHEGRGGTEKSKEEDAKLLALYLDKGPGQAKQIEDADGCAADDPCAGQMAFGPFVMNEIAKQKIAHERHK